MVQEQQNDETKVPVEQSEQKVRKKPVRSPFPFPSYDFGVAKQIAEKVEFDGAGRLSEETLAISLHSSAKSSGFRLKVLTARQFQLLTKDGDMLSTTPLAKAIFKPTTEEEKKRKMMESFIAIPLFNAVATRFSRLPLPPSQSFRNILEREFGVESNRVSEAERVLMDSAREATLLRQSGDKAYLVTEISSAPQPTSVPESRDDSQPPAAKPPSTPPIKIESGGGLLTVSEKDLAGFEDKEFNDIWQALGKIVRARGKREQESKKE